MRFKDFLEANLPGTINFTTAGGSTYQFANGRTVRNKAVHQFHEPGDVGVKPQSDLTVFVDPQLAREVGMWQTSSASKKRVVLDNTSIYLLSLNPRTNEHGRDSTTANAQYSPAPRIGLCPLELFQRDTTPWPWAKPGISVFAGSHPGSPITSVNQQ